MVSETNWTPLPLRGVFGRMWQIVQDGIIMEGCRKLCSQRIITEGSEVVDFSSEQREEENGTMEGGGEEQSDLSKGIGAESSLQAQRIGRRPL